MAFGFPPKHTQAYPLSSVDKGTFLVFASEAARKLEWEIHFMGKAGFVAYSKSSWRTSSDEIIVKIEENEAFVTSASTGNQIVDWGRNKKNVEVFIATVDELKQNLNTEEIAAKITILEQEFTQYQTEDNEEDSFRESESWLSLFKPTRGYMITPLLILLNVILFVLMIISGVHIISPDGDSLLAWGANFEPLTLNEPWRLLTACFIHIGILHLLLNMYALLYIGFLLERHIGAVRFLTAYLIAGVAASMISLWWNEWIVSAGASGAIFGMYGVFIALLSANFVNRGVKTEQLTSMGIFVAYNLIYGLRPDSGIDNAAHIGGLLSGLLIGYAFLPGLKQPKKIWLTALPALALISILSACWVFGINQKRNDLPIYESQINRIMELESKALEFYELPLDSMSKEEILSVIANDGIHNWDEGLFILKGFDTLHLPTHIKDHNEILKRYIEGRKKVHELLYKAIDEDTDMYDNEIERISRELDTIFSDVDEE